MNKTKAKIYGYKVSFQINKTEVIYTFIYNQIVVFSACPSRKDHKLCT